MANVVNWLNVVQQLLKQGELLPHQRRAFEYLNQAAQEGRPIAEIMQRYTAIWRSVSVVPAVPPLVLPYKDLEKTQQQDYWETQVKMTVLEQPDAVTCQATSICMLLGWGADRIGRVRSALEQIGQPGAPQVMAAYLRKQLGSQYSLHLDANLHEVIGWLQAGEALITHGYHTESGHVFVLCGVDPDEETGAIKFKVADPYGKFDCKIWDFVPGTRSFCGWVAAYDIYALCVVTGGLSSSRHAYRNSELDLATRGMWVHRVRPAKPATAQLIAKTRRCNAAGLKIIKSSEGLELQAYICPAGVPTIGRGSTLWFDNKPVRLGQTCTVEQADKLFERDLARFETDVSELITAPTSDNQFSALVSFAHNCGSDRDGDGIAEGLGDSTLLRKHNAGDYQGAKQEFARWVKDDKGKALPGLVKRRALEAELYGRKD